LNGEISTDLDGPLTRFQRHGIFEVSYLKNGASLGQSFYRTLTGNHTQSIEWYHFQWPWVASGPDFKVMTFLKSNIRKTAHPKDKVTVSH